MSLPESYPSPLHLPFNRLCLADSFLHAPPDSDPGGEGVLILLRGTELLLPVAAPSRLPPGAMIPPGGSPLFIGTWQGLSCRALRLSASAEIPEGLEAHNILAPEPEIPLELLSLAGVAGQMLHWERGSCACSRCGAAMERVAGEWGKRCTGCGYEHYPHIHPCVIVIVRREGEVLLTRKAEWPPGRYSLVAGFLDFGECLEEAVEREVMEETGIRVKNVRYIGSQSWPFPSQLMAGFTADYAGGEVVVEEKELEDARWFPLNALPTLPPRRSIARYLIDRFAKV